MGVVVDVEFIEFSFEDFVQLLLTQGMELLSEMKLKEGSRRAVEGEEEGHKERGGGQHCVDRREGS